MTSIQTISAAMINLIQSEAIEKKKIVPSGWAERFVHKTQFYKHTLLNILMWFYNNIMFCPFNNEYTIIVIN